MEQLEFSYASHECVKWHNFLENFQSEFTKNEHVYSVITNGSPRYILNRNVYICAIKGIYKNVHGNSICNSQKLEMTKCPLTVGQILVLYKGIPHDNKKKLLLNAAMWINLTNVN